MAVITSIIDVLRRLGSPTQRSAIQRQDEQLKGKVVLERRRHVARSELGEASQFVATTEPTPETVVPLTEAEVAPINENASLVEAFAEAFLGHSSGGEFLNSLDSAFELWSLSSEKKGYSNEAVIEIAGAAFGRFCVEKLDMRWVRITDEHGEAIAIQGRTKDFRGFPYHIISKRLPLGEYGFFKGIYISLQDAAQREWQPVDA